MREACAGAAWWWVASSATWVRLYINMLMKTIIGIGIIATMLAGGGLGASAFAAATEPISGKQAFQVLKGLAGEWTGKMQEGGAEPSVTILYRVTAAQSAVVETLFPNTDHEMVTVYHMDGEKLVLTHYCAAGNQPHMALTKKATSADLVFDFVSGSNMNPKKDAHMHSAHIHLESADRILGEWTGFKDGKPNHSAKFWLTRKKLAVTS